LTTFFNDITILDIGTFTGRSAIALSYNETNRVISYDVEDHIKTHGHPIYTKSNVEFRIGDVLRDLTEDFIRTVKIVMIDIDRYGDKEKMILDRLKELGFKGLMLLDDITKHPDPTINRCMNQFWDSIEDTCYDMTEYGHCTGTGVVVIGDDIRFCR
jgi:predicted O-methyltransferase YrrM